MQVKVTLTLKEEELKKIMDETGLTKPDEIKGYFYARERRNIDCEFGRRYNIDVKVDDTDDKFKKLGETLSGFFGICTEPPVVIPIKKPEVKEVKRKAKAGEWIKITNEKSTEGKYKNGDILKVDRRYCIDTGIYATKFNFPYIFDSEYVVLENYEPEDGEKK